MSKLTSTDGITRKYLFAIRDGKGFVETTYVDYFNKHIICFSSMMGCPIGCKFCASGYKKAVGILSKTEIIQQCKNTITQEHINDDKVILFSCMGEGEPFLNYRNVIDALKELTNQYPNSKIAISTTGIKPHLIEQLATEQFKVPVKLQVSIHSMDNNVRLQMMPQATSLANIEDALKVFKRSDKTLEFNYVLFDSVNDSNESASMLARYADGTLIKLNRYNIIPECDYHASKNVKTFTETLDKHNAVYEIYETDGSDIGASCGQLTYKLL